MVSGEKTITSSAPGRADAPARLRRIRVSTQFNRYARRTTARRLLMFIAMNRFQVKIGSEAAFENVWRSRESYLGTMAGFVEFNLLKGPVYEDHTLYSSHTTWVDKAAFEAWTRSEEFRRAHARADNKTGESLYLGHPKFEGFEVILSERKSSAAA
jgi:heme-degrading monooxygenase HmoA